jgi:RNA polymerase sigma-70 factor (ECF subfamily)
MDVKQTVNELVFGDAQKAMKELYMYYYPKLVLFVSYYIKSKHDAEEIVSDTFYAVWEQREKLFKVQNFNTYIYAIAKNNVFDFLKYKEKNNMYIKYDISEVEYLVKSTSDPETDFIRKELLERLNDAIESLPTQNKIAFKLVRELRLKYKEAAEIMGISLKTLEAHVTSATKRLEKELNSL